jgi:hypothetical protein
MPCKNERDVTSFLLSLATIIDMMNLKIVKKELRRSMPILNKQKISYYLEKFFILKKCKYKRDTLNNISIFETNKKLRNTNYPVHKITGYKKYCKIIAGEKTPGIEKFVLCCISKFQMALTSLRNSLITGQK